VGATTYDIDLAGDNGHGWPVRMTIVATSQPDTPADDGVAAFLSQIDPAELERVALNRLDLEGGENMLTAAMLRQLIEWATGA
jgi:hypothetical protein